MASEPAVLIIDPDEAIRATLADALEAEGYAPSARQTAEEGLQALRSSFFNLALVDLLLPERSGLEVLDDIKARSPDTEVIMITAHPTVASAVQAMEKGAFSLLAKPIEMDHLPDVIARAMERQRLPRDVERRHRQLSALYEVTAAVNASWDRDVTIASALDRLLKVTEAEMAMVRLLDELSGTLVLKVHRHLPTELVEGIGRRRLEEDTVGSQVFTTGQNLLIDDTQSDPQMSNEPLTAADIRSLLAAPITWEGKVLGTLEVASRRPGQFDGQDRDLVSAIGEQMGVAIEKAKAYEELRDLSIGFITALVAAVEAKDPYTEGHSQRVAEEAAKLAREMGLPDQQRERLRLAALLHDIGMIGTPDAILHKEEALSDQEWEVVQAHAVRGADIVANIRGLRPIVPWIRGHHERHDGTGYPDGLAGKEIPLGARIVAVVDAFDAMISPRPYRSEHTEEEARKILSEGAGTQWDPTVVKAFLGEGSIGGEAVSE